ncbi:hypothetical protein AB1Y20_016543 [Prymnesium parvum]|uniref:Ferrochelatase n=1 Tax=Prymnesium parvum TaxID=97485 RepID=A0AB34IDL7_PRYPA
MAFLAGTPLAFAPPAAYAPPFPSFRHAAPPPAYAARCPSLRLTAELARPTAATPSPEVSLGNIGVLLLNLGGPDTLDEVEPFLYNLFSDPEIITLPSWAQWLNGPVAKAISTSRAPTSKQGYAAIGGGSPQLATTIKQGEALEKALKKRGITAKSYIAMRYWHPYTEEALEQIKRDRIERLVVLPLYPQFSISTSGSSLRLLEREYYKDRELRQVRNVVIPAWYNREGYVAAMARLIADRCERFDDPTAPHIFFSAHGLPLKYVEDLGDPYKDQIEASCKFIMAKLRSMGYPNDFTLAYQSKVGPVPWLKPYTDDKIRELGAQGIKQLVVVPVSFVSEHIETLEEIDMEYRELAEESGIDGWERVPALGLETDFIDDLAAAVEEALPRTAFPVVSDINEGRPVSLRVVNDLVQLRAKEELIEYGPVNYEVRRVGFTPKAEIINGRIAMAAITAASAISYAQGSLWSSVIDGRLPFSFW